MVELLSNYSTTDILIFIVVLALAIKGVVTFFDWAKNRLKQAFDTDYKKSENEKALNAKLQDSSDIMSRLSNQLDVLGNQYEALGNKVDMLIESDKDDIKSFLTREHHYFCYQKGWIDDYSLECCERRYAHYKEEGGNSFIAGFMEEMRNLPKVPPT